MPEATSCCTTSTQLPELSPAGRAHCAVRAKTHCQAKVLRCLEVVQHDQPPRGRGRQPVQQPACARFRITVVGAGHHRRPPRVLPDHEQHQAEQQHHTADRPSAGAARRSPSARRSRPRDPARRARTLVVAAANRVSPSRPAPRSPMLRRLAGVPALIGGAIVDLAWHPAAPHRAAPQTATPDSSTEPRTHPARRPAGPASPCANSLSHRDGATADPMAVGNTAGRRAWQRTA